MGGGGGASPPRRGRRWRARLLALALAVLLALALAEVATRALGLGYLNLPTVPHPTRHHWHAAGDRWLVWGPHDEYGGFEARTNSDGFAMADELPPPGTPSLVVLGDSFVEGLQVPEAQRLTPLLGRRLGVAGLSFGCASYCPLLERLLLEEHQARVTPRAVVLLLFGNDVQDELTLLPRARRDATGRILAVDPEGSGLLLRAARRSHVARLVVKTWRARTLDRELAERMARAPAVPGARWRPYFDRPLRDTYSAADLAQVEGSLLELRDLCRARGWPLVISTVPDRGALEAKLDDFFADHFAAWAAREGVAFHDLRPAFRAHEVTRLFFPTDIHLTAEGHAVVADALAPAIRGAMR